MKYTIYKHTNNITGKSYIGQTKFSIEQRLKQHYIDARNSSNNGRNLTRPFHLALLKYQAFDWYSEVLEVTTKENASIREKYWISVYKTYTDGYNATIGGDYLEGYIPPKGDSNPSTDTTVYTFYHRYYPQFTGTVNQFCLYTGFKTNSIRSLVTRKENRSMHGWVLNPLHLYFRVGLKRIAAPTGTLVHKATKKACPKCHSVMINYKAISCIACRDTSGENNGMYGKTQPNYVKEAVRLRMYQSADQTLRTWIHGKYGIEYNIKTIDLRNKYKSDKLSISSLKKVTDNVQKQHKGWYLHEP